MAYAAILGQTGSSGILPQITITPIRYTYTSVVLQNNETSKQFTATYDGSNWVAQVDEYGTYTITGTYSGGTKTATLDVEVNQEYSVTLGYTPVPTLNDNDWATIRYASDNNLGESLWSVGDSKQITINGTIGTVNFNNYNTWVYILGFNHNAFLEGNNRIHFGCFRNAENYTSTNSIALVDRNYGTINYVELSYHMNNSESNYGGWESSLMRKTILDADVDSPSSSAVNSFLSNLPDDLKGVLKICTKYTDNVGNDTGSVQSNVTATQDWCFLLSEFEVTGTIDSSNSYEQNYQKQYQYYINGNSKIKYRHTNTSQTASWWLRSPTSYNDYGFMYYFSVDGQVQMGNAVWPYGLAPAFCV